MQCKEGYTVDRKVYRTMQSVQYNIQCTLQYSVKSTKIKYNQNW